MPAQCGLADGSSVPAPRTVGRRHRGRPLSSVTAIPGRCGYDLPTHPEGTSDHYPNLRRGIHGALGQAVIERWNLVIENALDTRSALRHRCTIQPMALSDKLKILVDCAMIACDRADDLPARARASDRPGPAGSEGRFAIICHVRPLSADFARL